MSRPKIIDEDAQYSSIVNDFDESKRIGEVLNRKYPGHLWAVNINQGVAFIRNLMLSGNWGFTIKTENIDNDYKIIMQAGGEILERYDLSRGKLVEDQILGLPRDFAQRPIGDKS